MDIAAGRRTIFDFNFWPDVRGTTMAIDDLFSLCGGEYTRTIRIPGNGFCGYSGVRILGRSAGFDNLAGCGGDRCQRFIHIYAQATTYFSR